MDNVRNYEEYRAEVLDTLGATVEDLRNEPSFRAKVLETLGVEFTDEDTRNFERYRLKALEGLKNGGGSGGGGSSDFSTANVSVTVNGEETFYIGNVVAINEEGMYWVEGFETGNYTMVLYKGTFEDAITTPEGYKVSSATGTDGVTVSTTPFGAYKVDITGDGTLTVGVTRA